MGSISVDDMLEHVGTLPVVVNEVLAISQDPNAPMELLTQTVAKDPVLAARVIRTANSSLFGLLGKVTDLNQAVLKLGMKKVKNICISLNLGQAFLPTKGDPDGLDRIEIWKHSVAVATMCEILANHLQCDDGGTSAGEAFLAGLVHDIGIILFDQHFPRRYGALPKFCQGTSRMLQDAETSEFGIHHGQLGHAFLKKWKFPESIQQAVLHHHFESQLQDHGQTLAYLVSVGDLVVSQKGVGFSDILTMSRNDFSTLASRLGLTRSIMLQVNQEFDILIKEALEIFSPSVETSHTLAS